MSDDAIERLHSNWSDELPRGWCEWKKRVDIEGIDVLMNQMCDIPNLDSVHSRRVGHLLGLVVSPKEDVRAYVDEHGNGTFELPRYYSDFGDEWKDALYSVEDGHSLRSPVVEAALRLLNGGGRYSRDEYTLYNCLAADDEPLPCPLIREDVGCVMISPVISAGDD
ncbi:hypothetical protein [Haloarcula litorea]|uniref:hypothetical protein n=1 Tax=Haloarcula litorea TaxID=3032579 RepID=UPI0023E8D80F|nr:hypothetical protein [Halomicroarcula sp. GDY20]